MRKKIPIVLASILKPVDDSRMLFKLGFSLRETNKYDLNIIGFSSKKMPDIKNVRFIPIFSKSRTHPCRIIAPAKFLFHLFRIKPRIVLVCTYELLPAAVFAKYFLSFKLVYDMQENYLYNLEYNQTLSGTKKSLAKFLVRTIENWSGRAIDQYIFAEKCYAEEMPGIDNPTVIENKANLPQRQLPSFHLIRPHSPRLLLTGTIARAYGISTAIKWFRGLREVLPEARLYISGHCPSSSYARQLEAETSRQPGIHLDLSPAPLAHSEVLREIGEADVLLLPYRLLPSIRNKIPTKLYEGIALQKPVLISRNEVWEDILKRYPAGMGVDFDDMAGISGIWEKFAGMEFYLRPPGDEVSWQSERTALLKLIDSLYGSCNP
ncbi:Glycosyltransferase involved in cell wall bisynthesis [Cyclobacterium lianum]|uniref:Glycosyltransferase involved in cell wall bisynthesis n=2 Tax=Cyclobacterium lianum TaxID=388280 RepID=A0A1M7M6K3_9BACT|nr:Glycosyltransferase involved in cell wall bisynthesis [Cyclobacterium lianum]